jgi:hypothetical protein
MGYLLVLNEQLDPGDAGPSSTAFSSVSRLLLITKGSDPVTPQLDLRVIIPVDGRKVISVDILRSANRSGRSTTEFSKFGWIERTDPAGMDTLHLVDCQERFLAATSRHK